MGLFDKIKVLFGRKTKKNETLERSTEIVTVKSESKETSDKKPDAPTETPSVAESEASVSSPESGENSGTDSPEAASDKIDVFVPTAITEPEAVEDSASEKIVCIEEPIAEEAETSTEKIVAIDEEKKNWWDECVLIKEEDCEFKLVDAAKNEYTLYRYRGNEKNIRIPAKFGDKVIVGIEAYANKSNVSEIGEIKSSAGKLDSVVVPVTVRNIEALFFEKVKRVYFEPESQLESIISKKNGRDCLDRVYIEFEEIAFPTEVDLVEFFSVAVIKSSCVFWDSVKDVDGILKFRNYHLGITRSLDVYDSGDAAYITLPQYSTAHKIGELIIREKVRDIAFPRYPSEIIDDVQTVNNPIFVRENGVVYKKTARKKAIIFISPSRTDSTLVIDSKVNSICNIRNPHIKTVIIEPKINLPDGAFDLACVDTVVSRNSATKIRTAHFINYEKGMTIYADLDALNGLKKSQKNIIVKPLSEYVEPKSTSSTPLTASDKSVIEAPPMTSKPKSSVEHVRIGGSDVLPKTSSSENKNVGLPMQNLKAKYGEKTLAKLEMIFAKLEEIYPEHKIFAFSALMDDQREALANVAKEKGLSGYEEILHDFGYEIINKDEVRTLRPSVIYTPGNEPECIKGRVNNVLKLLGEYYPNKIIEKPIDKEHKSLGGKITGLYQWLGYSSLRAFIEAYGYEYRVKDMSGSNLDVGEIIDYLKRTYTGNRKVTTLVQLYEENPEIVSQLKKLYTQSEKLFGMDFSSYLISIGVLDDKKTNEKEAFESILAFLKKNYPAGTGTLTLAPLYKKHPELEKLCKLAEQECQRQHGKTLKQYLREIGILKSESTILASKFSDFEFNKTQTHIVKYLGTAERVSIPAKVNTIDKYAFANSNVVEVVLEPNSALKHIDNAAFENCHALVTLDFRNSQPNEFIIDEGAFKNCDNLEQIMGEWDDIKTHKGAFEGCKKIFVRDGDYIYPRMWLYNWLNNSDAAGAFNLEGEKVDGFYLSCVIMINRHTKRQVEDIYYMPFTKIPVAADAGYGNVVFFAGLIQTRENNQDKEGMDKVTANSTKPTWTVFYMPTEETVEHFLNNLVVDAHNYFPFLSDEIVYREKQRNSFKEFNEYYAKARAELSSITGMERIDYSFENPVTAPAKKMARVTFIGHAGYRYRCNLNANVGDVVYVDGSRTGDLGVICDVSDDWNDSDYFKDVIKCYRQTNFLCESPRDVDVRVNILFKGACTIVKLSNLFSSVPIIGSSKKGTKKATSEASGKSPKTSKWVQLVLETNREKTEYFAACPRNVSSNMDMDDWNVENSRKGLVAYYAPYYARRPKDPKQLVVDSMFGLGDVGEYRETMETLNTNGCWCVGGVEGSEKLVDVQFGYGTEIIEDGAFSGCSKLKKVILPDSVERIGAEAFMDCAAMETCILSENLEQIDYLAFSGCISIKTVILPAKVESIADNTFSGCKKLEAIIFLNGDCYIEEIEGWEDCKATFVAPAGGEVEKYAMSNDIQFEELDLEELNKALGEKAPKTSHKPTPEERYAALESAVFSYFDSKKEET